MNSWGKLNNWDSYTSSSSRSRGRKSSYSSHTTRSSYRSDYLRQKYQPKSDSRREAALIKQQQTTDSEEFDCRERLQDLLLCCDENSSGGTYGKPPRNDTRNTARLEQGGKTKGKGEGISLGWMVSICNNDNDDVSTLCCDPVMPSKKSIGTNSHSISQKRKNSRKQSKRRKKSPRRKNLVPVDNRYYYQSDQDSFPMSSSSSDFEMKITDPILSEEETRETQVSKDKSDHYAKLSRAELAEEISTVFSGESTDETVKDQFKEFAALTNGVMMKYNNNLQLVPALLKAQIIKRFQEFSANDCEGRLDIFDNLVNEGVEIIFPEENARMSQKEKNTRPLKYIRLGSKDTQSTDSDEMSSISSIGKTYAQRTVSERTIRQKTSDFSSTDSANDENRVDGKNSDNRENNTSSNFANHAPKVPALKNRYFEGVNKMMVPLGDKCRMEIIRNAKSNSGRSLIDPRQKLIDRVNSGIKLPTKERRGGSTASTPLKEVKVSNKANKFDSFRLRKDSQDEQGDSDALNYHDNAKTNRSKSSQFKRFFSPLKSTSKSTSRGRSPTPMEYRTRERSRTPLKNNQRIVDSNKMQDNYRKGDQLSEARLSLPYKNREMSKNTEHLRVILKNRESSRSVASRTRKTETLSPLSHNRNVQKGLRPGHSKRNIFI